MVLLLGITMLISQLAHVGTAKESFIATLRAIVQLGLVSLIVVAAVQQLWSSILFAILMFCVAVWTTAQRTETVQVLGWVALAITAGLIPVLAIIFASRTVPFNGLSLVPFAGIVTGNMMTVHTLLGRRLFAALRENNPIYEAALALGMPRSQAIAMVIDPLRKEALLPNLDQTRATGLVTLPGAFIGVLLGGGSPLQAASAQVLILIAIMCGQMIVVVVATSFMSSGKLLPHDLQEALHI
ncbi:MAG: ABC transporter permease [Propionibacteriaceae bacterium]